ncbi:MAG TPA: hypothetical protein VE178_16735, partial [Silvibacterium sp.]|nr:hypothetical protein [Silvibacterium sp.]
MELAVTPFTVTAGFQAIFHSSQTTLVLLLAYFSLAAAGISELQGRNRSTGPAQSLNTGDKTVSNKIYTETNLSAEITAELPRISANETKVNTAGTREVPTTADLPMLPELRERAQAINWRAALSSASLAAFLAIVAGVGCGTGAKTMLKPSAATPAVVDKALWVANGTNVVEFIPSQLTSGSSDPAPHLSINSTVFGAPQGVTFDANGNLWVIDGGTVAAGGNMAPALFEFTAAQL